MENVNEEKELPTSEETIEELMERIKALEQEKEQYVDNLKRAKGDVLKMSVEFEKKIQEMEEIANFQIVYYLVNVLDAFELAFSQLPQDQIFQGFYMIYSQLKDILQKFGLEEIDSENKKFDPNFHEVIASQKCSKENCAGDDDGIIVEVFSKGYLFKGRILRPARVKIINH